MTTSEKRPSPYLVLFLGIFAVSTSSIFIRFAQAEAPSLAIAAYRMGIASLILLPFTWRKRRELGRLGAQGWGAQILSGAFLAVHFATWITSLSYTSVTSSVVLVTTTPLWVALFSPLVLKERLRAQTWIGLAVAFVGGALVGLHEVCAVSAGGIACQNLSEFTQGKEFLGNLLALTGAWMAAGYLLIGRKVRPTLSLDAYIGTVYALAAVFLFLLAGVTRTELSGFSAETFLWFGALAIFPQLLGHTSYNYALGYLPAAYVSIAVLAEPIGSSILAVLALKEIPSELEILGGVIILAGVGLASWKK